MTRLLLLLSAALAACQGDAPPPPAAQSAALVEPEAGVLHLMGTGAMTPLALELAAQWRRSGHVPQVVVEPSVGSGGGVRAAADGAVDLGMISRALSPDEAAQHLYIKVVARDAVVLAAHRSVTVDGLSRDELVALTAGRSTQFSDGTPATLLIRDAKESANEALERVVPELRQLREEVYRTGRLRVLYHDDAMGQSLALTPGGVGVFSLGAIAVWKLPLKVLALDGLMPSMESLTDGRWRATRELAFVFRPERAQRVAEFLAFVMSATGRQITREAGYLPLGEGTP